MYTHRALQYSQNVLTEFSYLVINFWHLSLTFKLGSRQRKYPDIPQSTQYLNFYYWYRPGQELWKYAIEFARWQFPEVGAGRSLLCTLQRWLIFIIRRYLSYSYVSCVQVSVMWRVDTAATVNTSQVMKWEAVRLRCTCPYEDRATNH